MQLIPVAQPVQATEIQEPIKKMSAASRVIEDEGLERPSESVKFAEYMHNHMKKTSKAKSALRKVSKVTMFIAIGSLVLVTYNLFMSFHLAKASYHQTGHARLRASREESND